MPTYDNQVSILLYSFSYEKLILVYGVCIMNSYNEAIEKLGNRESRKLENNTYLKRRSETKIAVQLHNTDVVTYCADGTVILNSGNWKTITTKDRINKYAPCFLYQENSQWFFTSDTFRSKPTQAYIFSDNMSIDKFGNVHNAIPYNPDIEKQNNKLKKQIRTYAKNFVTEFFNGNVPAPSGGDCWYCYFVDEKTGKPISNSDHLLSHINEKYYVPSLLVHAIKEFPISIIANSCIHSIWYGTEETKKEITWYESIAKEQIQKSITRYMYRQLEFAS